MTQSHDLTPARSRVEMTQIVMPTHTNGVGGVLFGTITGAQGGRVLTLQGKLNW